MSTGTCPFAWLSVGKYAVGVKKRIDPVRVTTIAISRAGRPWRRWRQRRRCFIFNPSARWQRASESSTKNTSGTGFCCCWHAVEMGRLPSVCKPITQYVLIHMQTVNSIFMNLNNNARIIRLCKCTCSSDCLSFPRWVRTARRQCTKIGLVWNKIIITLLDGHTIVYSGRPN